MSHANLTSAVYTIESVIHGNMVHLPDGNYGSLLTARPHASDASEKWAITLLSNKRYHIQNRQHKTFAGVTLPVQAGGPIQAVRGVQEWLILETPFLNEFVITTVHDGDPLGWCLINSNTGTNVELAGNLHDTRNRWRIELASGGAPIPSGSSSPNPRSISSSVRRHPISSDGPASGSFPSTLSPSTSPSTHITNQGFNPSGLPTDRQGDVPDYASSSTSTSNYQIPKQGSRPLLHREGKSKQGGIVHNEAQPDDLSRHRFNLDIKSIYYFPGDDGSTRCAVLLSAQFALKTGHKMSFANVPLGVSANIPTVASSSTVDRLDRHSSLEFGGYHPSSKQRMFEGYQERRLTESTREAVKAVSLYAERTARTDERIPDIIKWIFKSHRSLDCPEITDLIVIAEKADNGASRWFPFTLHLRKELVVDLHGLAGYYHKVERFVGKSPPEDGWVFRIKGEYKPGIVKEILGDNIKEKMRIDALVGLGPSMSSP